MQRSQLDHLQLVVSNGPEMAPKQTAASRPDAKPAKKPKDTFHVLLPAETKERIEAAGAQLKKRLGFEANFTQSVLNLLDDALKRLEEERQKAGPPTLPKDVRF